MLVSVGERISNALCAMAIRDLGHEAVSLTGSQAGIVTDTVHGKAKIVEVRARRLHAELDRDRIVLVAGFQGVSTDLRGDDARPRRLRHDRGRARRRARRDACEIYTDVEGVFTADPRIVADALKLPSDRPTKRCSRWRRPARGDDGDARSRSRAATVCRSTCARRSATATARGSARRRTWCSRRRSSPASRTTRRRRRRRSSASPTVRASRHGSSARSRTPA